MKLLLTILILTILSISSVLGQPEFFLRNKKTGLLKKIKSSTNFGFSVWNAERKESLVYHGHIIQMTDSTLIVEEYVKPSMRHAVKPKLYTLNIHDVISFKNYLIDNDDFNTFGGMLVIGGALGLVATPIVWAADGKKSGEQAASLTAGLLAAGGLLLLPQFIGKRRMMTRWEFVKR